MINNQHEQINFKNLPEASIIKDIISKMYEEILKKLKPLNFRQGAPPTSSRKLYKRFAVVHILSYLSMI